MINLTISGYPPIAMQHSPFWEGALLQDLKSISIEMVKEKTKITFSSPSESRVYNVKPSHGSTDSFKVKFIDSNVNVRTSFFITDLKPPIDFSAVKKPVEPQQPEIAAVSLGTDEYKPGSSAPDAILALIGAVVIPLVFACVGWKYIVESIKNRQFDCFPKKTSTYDKIALVVGFILGNVMWGFVIYVPFAWVKSNREDKARDMQEKQIEKANRLVTLVAFGLQNPGAWDKGLKMPAEVSLVLQKPENQ